MGLGPFSGKTIVAVDVFTNPLHDTITEDRLTTAIVTSIQHDLNLADSILYNNLTGYKASLVNYYDYGELTYINGIPTSNLANNSFNVSAVNSVIDTIEGSPTTILYSYYYVPTAEVWGRYWLQENESNYSYDDHTLLQDSITWDVIGFEETTAGITVLLENGATEDTYSYIPLIGNTEQYYIVEYYVTATPANKFIWLYQESLGTYPTLDTTNEAVVSDIYPIVPVRLDFNNVNEDETSEEYITTKALLKKTKIDLDEFTEAITKQPNDAGDLVDVDDLDKISDIFILYGLSIYGTAEVEQKALYNLFSGLIPLSRVDINDYTADLVSVDKEVIKNVYTVDSTNFNYEINYSYITSTEMKGQILGGRDYSVAYTVLADSDYSGYRVVESYITIQAKIDANTYDEIVVKGLYLTHTIKTVRNDTIAEVFLLAFEEGTELTEEHKNFIIPLSQSEINNLSIREVDFLIPRCAHTIIYASDSQYVKWYRTGAFGTFLQLAFFALGLIISPIDPSGTSTKILFELAKRLVVQYAIEFILQKLLVEFSGNKKAQVAILAIATFISIKANKAGLLDLSTVEELIIATNALSKSITTYTKTEADALEEQYQTFLGDIKSIEEDLKDAQDFLDVRSTLDISAVSTSNYNSYEKPEDFFSRTLNTAPGQEVFNELHSYVDNNLNLEYITI